MMARTQITLEPELHHSARRRAAEMGISLAEYLRRLVARDLARTEQKPDVSRIFNLGSSGDSDIAADKHAMLAEAFEASHRHSISKPASR